MKNSSLSMHTNKWLLTLFLFSVSCLCRAQITTSSVSGRITDEQASLPGAHIMVVHEPSGTSYGTIANKEGYYLLKGLRPGGPYQIRVSYVGYRTRIIKDIFLRLGETYSCNARLTESTELEEVVVLGTSFDMASNKTGASTHITTTDINRLPNISRSLQDLTRLSPYAMSGGFGGRDVRMNNYSIDGANFNYNMGLDNKALPGDGNPISLDALEEIQVSIAPYDVKQTNFIGGSVNAVTKSGTNQFRGTAYMYWKNEHLRGNTVNGYDLGTREKESRNVYGVSLGGPLIKDKLFFFINGEYEDAPYPIHKWKLSTDGKEDPANLISRVTAEDMSRFSADLKSMYGYDTGSWTDFSGGASIYRLLARVDWNINKRHKLMLRYNYVSNEKDNNVVGAALDDRDIGNPVSAYSMTFRNSTWKQINRVNSLTAELNSRLSNQLSNTLLASFTFNDGNKRECNGEFPTIDIMKQDDSGTNRAYMNTGYDQHAWHNGITEKVWNVTDNLSWSLGNHQLAAGISFESQNVSNCYMRYGAGYYRYNTYDDFLNKAAPTAFALTYSLTGEEDALSDVHYNQFSVYAQDEMSIGSRLKLLYGVRMDVPFYVNERYENPSIAEVDFNGTRLNTAHWPKATPVFSPRIGFNYDLLGNGTLKLRGGTGLFNGRFALIFLSKMQEGSGMIQTTISTKKAGDALLAALAGGIRTPQQVLQEIAPRFPDRFPTEPGAVSNIVTVDRDFKMPQVWKSSLAVDYRLPLSFPATLTLEGTFIKDIYGIVQRDVNIDATKIKRFAGPDNRYQYLGNTEKSIHKDINYAVLMENTSKGYSANFNATLKMNPLRGVNFMAAYTFTASKNLTSNRSNQVEKALWQEPSVMGYNYQKLHNSRFLTSPHRVIAQVGYTFEYARHCATSVSLFYEGQHGGSYSYIYDGDMNNDGKAFDLLYIPRTRDELIFADKKVGDKVFTADEQRDAFWKFINQDPYLRKHKGEYAEAYGAYLPWVHRFDLRLMQEFKLKVGSRTNKLQLSVDVMNIGNLLKDSWGVIKNTSSCSGGSLLKRTGLTEAGEPVYNMTTIKEDGKDILPYRTFMDNRASDNCWQLQFGIRYVFH